MPPKVDWFKIQENTFTRWCNDELKQRGMRIENMEEDLKDGLLLINLMEIISGKKMPRYNKHPRIISQKMENLNIVIQFIQNEGLQLVNVGSDDICSGNMRIILGLIWTLILRYEIHRGGDDADKSGSANDLLRWIQSKIPEYNITNFTKNWNDGRAVCALTEACRPGSFPDHKSLDPSNKLDNATRGIAAAETIGVDRLVYPEEMVHPKVDKLAMMTYLAQFRNLPEAIPDPNRCKAYGPGLVEAIQGEPAPFTMEKPSDVAGNLEVKVVGPQSEAKVEIKQIGPEKWDVQYHPTEPGEYEVHVTLNGDHIPGSIFHVTVAAEVSLGGQGKIFVFYSSTTAMQKQRKDFQSLQRLFQRKKVHLREDFEPWIAVDLLARKDREAVYKKSGVRTLPQVFVDDVYRGGYDEIAELEEYGKLDDVLHMKGVSLVSEEQHLQRLKTLPADSKDKSQFATVLGEAADEAKAPAATVAAAGGKACCAGSKAAGSKFCGECGARV